MGSTPTPGTKLKVTGSSPTRHSLALRFRITMKSNDEKLLAEVVALSAGRVSKSARSACLLSLAAWLIYLSVLAPSLSTWDGGGMLNASISLIQKHDWTVEPIYGQVGRHGKLYGMW